MTGLRQLGLLAGLFALAAPAGAALEVVAADRFFAGRGGARFW